MRWLLLLHDGCSILYVALSVASSFVVLDCLVEYTRNDFFWPNFDTSNTSAVLCRLVNEQLAFATSSHVILNLSNPLAIPNSVWTPTVKPVYTRMLMYHELTTIESAIRGLRTLSIAQVLKMITPYCWVDFERHWELAYTLQRQKRCLELDKTNAAVYMEAVLRNIDLADWIPFTQGRFTSKFLQPIASANANGQAWVANILAHTWSNVDVEIRIWESYGLSEFTLQYGNRVQIGLEETILIENALGQQIPWTIKSIPRIDRWMVGTSGNLYDLLLNDMFGVGANQSFVRNTTNFWADIDPTQIEAYNYGVPLTIFMQAVHNQIGALGTIDAKWLSPPVDFIVKVQEFQTQVAQALLLNATVNDKMMSIGTMQLAAIPSRWGDPLLYFYGGNPLCNFGSPLQFPGQTFGFDDACASHKPFTVDWNPMNSVFAMAALGDISFSLYCSQVPASIDACNDMISNAQTVAEHLSFTQISLDSLKQLNLSFLQFISKNLSQVPTIDQQFILDPSWSFFGLMSLYDWATNSREAISMQGDIATYNILSYNYDTIPQQVESPTAAIAPYLWIISAVLTYVLAAVGCMTIIMWLFLRPQKCELYFFNRLFSPVWLSRNIILVRGLTAILTLATAPVGTLHNVPSVIQLAAIPRSWFLSCLLSGETMWVLYSLHDAIAPWLGLHLRIVGPSAAFISWSVIAAMDIWWPVQPFAKISRECYTIDMDNRVYCSSGSVQIGSFTRLIIICCIQVVATLISIATGIMLKRPNQTASLFLQASSAAFVNQTPDGSMDCITSALCGIIQLNYKNHSIAFDTKLWLFLAPSDKIKVLPGPVSSKLYSRSQRVMKKLVIASGLLYLGCTFASNLAYLNVLSASLANDFGWAGFNTSGMHVFLANTINRQLFISTHQNLVLDSPFLSDTSQLYNGSETTISWFPSNANRELFSRDNTLHDIVFGLRQMNPCTLPWMFTQYCWLDFDRNWEMASSTLRQQRCLSAIANGARYLESSLRNVNNWDTWKSCWGRSFHIGFGTYLNSFQHGQAWMLAVQSNYKSIDQEVEYWINHGITSFILQWQNYKTLGLIDSMTISTALGMMYQLPLSHSQGVMHFDQQTTSIRMYWAFASDLWAIASNSTSIKGHSLLRASANFAFHNISVSDILYENTTLIAPLSPGLVQTANSLGPFGNIDMEYVLCPSNLVELYGAVRGAVANLTLKSTPAQRDFMKLPLKAQIGPVPTDLLARTDLVAGGNIFCGDDAPAQPTSYGLDVSFGSGNLCHWLILESITPSTIELLFAFLALGAVNTSDLVDICNLDALQEPTCVDIYNASSRYISTYASSFKHLSALVPSVKATVLSLNISLAQFLQGNDTILYTVNIIEESDRPWTFYGWCFLFEWATGQREVVSFQGDSGNLTLLSTRSDPLSMVLSSNDIPVQIAYIFQRCAQYVTLVLIGVAFLLVIYGLLCRGHIEGMNLFEMNRIVGHVWVGRSLLTMRSITAVWLLNTTPLELIQVEAATQITSPRLSWYKTFLAASELTWLVYMLNDVLSFLTKSYTTYYAVKSSILTWSVAVIYTIIIPQEYQAKIDRSCIFIDMDMQLVCNSAFISIGSFSRTASDIGIAVGSVLIAATAEALWRSRPKTLDVPVGFLSSTSFYLFEFTDWIDQDECYLDQASAAMAGLLTLRHQDHLYIFDIKTWRYYACSTDRCKSQRWGDDKYSAAIPLQYVSSSLKKM